MTGHKCPATGCTLSVAPGKLLCRSHWFMVPAPLREAVWDAWADGAGAGSPAHSAACDAAIGAVNRKIDERAGQSS